MRRAALYTRVSTLDQNTETQALDLRRLAEQRAFEIVHEYMATRGDCFKDELE